MIRCRLSSRPGEKLLRRDYPQAAKHKFDTAMNKADAEPHEMLMRRLENRDALRRGLALLPEDDRGMLLLQAIEGLTTHGMRISGGSRRQSCGRG
jgi:DNA-directed RNA polymerase specialized sigma24 family protein